VILCFLNVAPSSRAQGILPESVGGDVCRNSRFEQNYEKQEKHGYGNQEEQVVVCVQPPFFATNLFLFVNHCAKVRKQSGHSGRE
jgi:hypothetical protein